MKKRTPSMIEPKALYSIQGFRACAGFTPTRMWELAKIGLRPETINVGRRKFIRGADAIAYIEAAARLSAAAATAGN